MNGVNVKYGLNLNHKPFVLAGRLDPSELSAVETPN